MERLQRIPCNPELPCPVRETIGCFEDVHHQMHPAADYTTPLERTFRELPENKDRRCRNIHNIEHETMPVPEKPDESLMALAVVEALHKGIITLSKTKMRKIRPAINRALSEE